MWLGLHRSTPNDDYTVLTGRLHGADTARSSEFTECIGRSTPNWLAGDCRPLLDSGSAAAQRSGRARSRAACSYYRDTGGFAETRCLRFARGGTGRGARVDEWKVADLAPPQMDPDQRQLTLAIFAVPARVRDRQDLAVCHPAVHQEGDGRKNAPPSRVSRARDALAPSRRDASVRHSDAVGVCILLDGSYHAAHHRKVRSTHALLWPGELNWLLMPPAIALVLLCIFPTDATSIRVTCVTPSSASPVRVSDCRHLDRDRGPRRSGYATAVGATTIVWLGSSVCICRRSSVRAATAHAAASGGRHRVSRSAGSGLACAPSSLARRSR